MKRGVDMYQPSTYKAEDKYVLSYIMLGFKLVPNGEQIRKMQQKL